MINAQIDFNVNEQEKEQTFSVIDIKNDRKLRNWVLTINNEPMTDEALGNYIQTLSHFKYCVFQREKGENTGTVHIQMYIEFSQPKRMSTIKSFFPRAHIEPRKGTKEDARRYCMKEDTRVSGPYEFGEFEDTGARSDLSTILKMVNDGASDFDIYKLYPAQYTRIKRHIAEVRTMLAENKYKDKYRELDVTYIYGETGVGKTRGIMEKYGYSNVYRITTYNSGAFDNYNGQDVIIFEEFHGQFDITAMLTYLDGYPLMLPCRYANKPACYTKVYILSNESLSRQYRDKQYQEPQTYNAFLRRINKVYYYDNKGMHDQTRLIPIDEDDPLFMEIDDIF